MAKLTIYFMSSIFKQIKNTKRDKVTKELKFLCFLIVIFHKCVVSVLPQPTPTSKSIKMFFLWKSFSINQFFEIKFHYGPYWYDLRE